MELMEKEMEVAVARCPALFIEPGLKFLRQQAVINGKRPDLIFQDGLRRHMVVELQRGRLDEDHLQRHFYYYCDYKNKYPETHPRLLFIANCIVPQHKEFLGFHGYEYREIPEPEFVRRVRECGADQDNPPDVILRETPGALPQRYPELLFEIELQRMTFCYKMLLLLEMIDHTDEHGRVLLRTVAEGFARFFRNRAIAGKTEENPKRFMPRKPSERSVEEWERTILKQPVHYLGERFVSYRTPHLCWADDIWSKWSPDLRAEIRSAAEKRLVNYFEKYVGGF